jgi:FKBP-type peptidyl-prolyl cis-trans isomerase FkpA
MSRGFRKFFVLSIASVLPIAWLLACSSGGDGGGGESGGGDSTTTASGLVITHIVEGIGPSPTPQDIVQVHYHGTFPDGTVFDSSVERGQPARFPLRGVIPCWTEGVAMMKVGGKAELICPPQIAYGERGAPPRIPPNATLHFEVELLGIQ